MSLEKLLAPKPEKESELFTSLYTLCLKKTFNEKDPEKSSEILQKIVNNHLAKNPDQYSNLFIKDEELGNFQSKELKFFSTFSTGDENFQIPASMFHSGSSLQNWNGRPFGNKKYGKDSGEIIQKYFKMPAKTMPRVIDLSFYIYKDGTV